MVVGLTASTCLLYTSNLSNSVDVAKEVDRNKDTTASKNSRRAGIGVAGGESIIGHKENDAVYQCGNACKSSVFLSLFD